MFYEYKTNKIMKNYLPFIVGAICFLAGLFFGYFIFGMPKVPKKEYPIQVQCYWETNGYQSYPSMECDSIKVDTVWKDGNKIVTKNIINVVFK